MGKRLTEKDYILAAAAIGLEPEKLQAVAKVESNGAGFDGRGRIILRFEGHRFRLLTGQRYDISHSDISYPYSQAGSKNHGYTAFNKAMAVDQQAALCATSFGKFQPMGETYDECGFESVNDYVDYLKQGEVAQLDCFIKIIKSRKLVGYLQRGDWASFARAYNGRRYEDNNYDGKIADAYNKYKNKLWRVPVAEEEAEQSEQAIQVNDDVNSASQNEQNHGPNSQPIVVEDQSPSLYSKITAGAMKAIGSLGEIGITKEVMLGKVSVLDPKIVVLGVIFLALIALGVWYYDRSARRAQERTLQMRQFAAAPNLTTVLPSRSASERN